MGVLYALVTLIAAYYVFELRDSQRAQVVEQLETTIQDQVTVWEDELLTTLAGWMDQAVATWDQASVHQTRMRQFERWFNGLYIWKDHTTSSSLRHADLHASDLRFVFPAPPVEEQHQGLTSRICIAVAKRLRSDGTLNAQERAAAYIEGCADESLPVRLYATSEAATILHEAGLVREALDAILNAGLADGLTLAAAAQQGIAPQRVFMLRLQQSLYLQDLGRTEEALDLLYRLGRDVARLDAPAARRLVQLARYNIVSPLRRHGRTEHADRLDAELDRAERRVAAYDEIEARILQPLGDRANPRTTTLGLATEAHRFIYDQYSETPFLLYYGWMGGSDFGVALQLEQNVLLEDFLRLKSLARLRRHVSITDAAGNFVAGSARGGPIGFKVPFPRTLTHLRVAVAEEAIATRMQRNRAAWITPLVIIALCGMLGVVALAVQVRANRQQAILLKRQRDFTTRVTHELKTPLAGIRVMAENLEAGAFRDTGQLRLMAQRIVEEADRLTSRVDEVLAVARDRGVPEFEPFDPEEAVLEAIDQWGPRFEQAGVALHADLHPTDEVRGDARAVRDAVSCLLDNALKYRREDRPDSAAWLTLEQQGGWVSITVTDNGIGVPPDMREAIFDRFVRVEGPNRGKAGGHGLGLSQVAAIARAHKGDVRCTEGVDGGARFVLRLPALPS